MAFAYQVFPELYCDLRLVNLDFAWETLYVGDRQEVNERGPYLRRYGVFARVEKGLIADSALSA